METQQEWETRVADTLLRLLGVVLPEERIVERLPLKPKKTKRKASKRAKR